LSLKKVFITGATGILGRELVKELIKESYEIIALEKGKNPERRKKTPFSEQIEWIEGDLGDLAALQKGMERADFVIHSAAMVSFQPSDKSKLLKTNFEGTQNVVNCALAASNLKKLVHISSVACLSPSKPQPTEVNELQGFNPDSDTSDYAYSKYLAELEIFRGVEEGLKAAIVNPSIILAKGDEGESSASLIHFLKKGSFFYPGGWLNLVDVRDVAKMTVWLLQNGTTQGERLVLNAECMRYHQLLQMGSEIFKTKKPRIQSPEWAVEMAWRILFVWRLISGKAPILTKYTAKASFRKLKYQSIHLQKVWPGFSFIPIRNTLKWIAEDILQNH
jgi:nucleoside-diphosphate-sugar epimerase